jgi:hypothetical protein
LDIAFEEAWNAASADPAMRHCVHQTILKYLNDQRYVSRTRKKELLRDLNYIHPAEILAALETLKELDIIECHRDFVYLSEFGCEYLAEGESLIVFLGDNLETKVLEMC